MKEYGVLLLFLFLVFPITAEDAIIGFAEPSSFRYTGMGGALTAVPEGLDMFLHNPAGFTQPLYPHQDRFIVSVASQFYFKPQYFFPILQDVFQVENKLGQILLNAKELITTSGLGATPNIAMGYIGKNWGMGLLFTTSAFVQGSPFPLGVEGFAMANLSLPVAYSLRVVESNRVDISLGATLRPSVALYKMIDGSDVDAIITDKKEVDDILEGILTKPYLSIPADLGIMMVGHDFLYKGTQLRVAATLKNLFGDYFVPGQSMETLSRQLAFNFGLGAYFPLEIGKFPLEFTLSAETKALNQIISGTQTFLKSLAMGVEVGLANFIRLWAGLTSGYPAIGGKLDLGIFSLGAAWQTIETGRYVGDNPLSIFHLGFNLEF